MNKIFVTLLISVLLISCGEKKSETNKPKIVKEKIVKQFGYTLNNYTVKRDTVKRGDSFGSILENNNLFYPQIYNIVQKAKKVFDVRRINLGKPYIAYHFLTHELINTFYDHLLANMELFPHHRRINCKE